MGKMVFHVIGSDAEGLLVRISKNVLDELGYMAENEFDELGGSHYSAAEIHEVLEGGETDNDELKSVVACALVVNQVKKTREAEEV